MKGLKIDPLMFVGIEHGRLYLSEIVVVCS